MLGVKLKLWLPVVLSMLRKYLVVNLEHIEIIPYAVMRSDHLINMIECVSKSS